MKSHYDIIKRPIITEKSSGLVDKLQYTFEVAVDANKVEIKKAIIAEGSKVPHLSYMGDCEIGTKCNIGCEQLHATMTEKINTKQKLETIAL